MQINPVTLIGNVVRLEPLAAERGAPLTPVSVDADSSRWIPIPGAKADNAHTDVQVALEEQSRGTRRVVSLASIVFRLCVALVVWVQLVAPSANGQAIPIPVASSKVLQHTNARASIRQQFVPVNDSLRLYYVGRPVGWEHYDFKLT